MRSVWAQARTEFRAAWRAWVALALIVGAGAGMSMALLSAARRTGDAYERFSARKNAADVVVAGSQAFGFVGNIRLDLVKQLPDIRLSADAFAVLLFTGTTDTGTSFGPSDIFPVAAQSTAVGTSVEGWKLLAGRRADPKNTTEAVASFELAQRLHLKVGSTLKIHFFLKKSFPQVAAQLLTAFPQRLAGHNVGPTFKQLADGPKLAIHVVGIEASPLEFPPLLLDISPLLHLTPAFFHTYSSRLVGSQVSYIRLDDPNKIEPFKAEVERLAHGQPVSFISTGAIQTVKVQRGFRVETTALAIVGVLIALTFLVVAAQGLTRQALAEAGDHPTLRALGMGPRQLRAVTLVRCFAIALPAAAIACIIAVALSPHMLLGLARKADLHPGIHPDGLVLALGALATIAGITITGVVVGRLASRRALPVTGERDRPRRSLLAAVTRGVALPPATAVGMRFALRRDRSAPGVPIWTTVVGAALTVALLVGTWSFTASLRQLINTPHLYGWNWDLRVGAPALPDIGGVIVPALQKNADVSGLSAGTVTQALVHQQRIDLLTVQPVEGVVTPTFVAGRPPVNSKEIALGARTMRSWNVKLDDRVTVRIGDASQPFRVVGRAVFPEFGDAGQLGTGAYVTLGGLDRLLHSLSTNDQFTGAPRNVFFIKFRPGTNLNAARARISAALDPLPHRVEGHPADLANLERVSALPELFSAILMALAVVLLVHTLVTSIRRRRRELAVLEAMGFVRQQVRMCVVTHSVTLVVISLLIGIPLGIGAGRGAWKIFASELGVVSGPVVPMALVIAAVVAAIVVAVLAALLPAWLATRRNPATPLRTAE